MEQELIYKNIGVVGCGASGGLVSILLTKNPYNKVTAFDIKEPFSTLLPTGGGRCNITNAKDDLKEFAKNYPRGDKFLLSVFYKFSSKDTRKLFADLGIKTYVQKDDRVFPISDSSKKTVMKLNEHLNTDNFLLKKEKVISVEKEGNQFLVLTEKNKYTFDSLIVATGGKGIGFDIAKHFGHNVVELRPSLCALEIKEENFYKLSGLTFENVQAKIRLNNKKYADCFGDILFSHKGITGPCVFKISALTAFDEFDENNPLEINLKLIEVDKDEIEAEIRNNAKKTIKNVFSKFLPLSFLSEILEVNKIDGDKQAAQIKKSEKDIIVNSLFNFKLHAIKRIKGSEIVMAGGVDLNEINPKTMESKIISNLYFIGEVLNIDGYTGGFNLQNCWSGAYICSLNF